jgi:Fe/S biogenesis protein NfuA
MTDVEMKEAVEKVFAEMITPALASHGGAAQVVKVEAGKVYVELQGGCRGCPGARATMKDGIERLLKEQVKGVEEVLDVTDHG